MLKSAAEEFACEPALLYLLGQQVQNKSTIRDLCLTSKSFNAHFTPFLYAELLWDEKDWVRYSQTKNIAYSRFIKKLNIEFPWDTRKLVKDDDIHVGDGIEELVKHVPGLLDFSCSYIPISNEALKTLGIHCKNLQSLKIIFPPSLEENLGFDPFVDEELDERLTSLRSQFLNLNFASFRGLRELEISEIYGDLNNARNSLVEVLLACPQLESLSLSISQSCCERQCRQGLFENHKFLSKLCQTYKERNGQPLNLKTLYLGCGIIPHYHQEPLPGPMPQDLNEALRLLQNSKASTALYLTDLTNLETLQSLHIENESIWDYLILEHSDFAWETFTKASCPNLKRASIAEINKEVAGWLTDNIEGENFSELVVYTVIDDDPLILREFLSDLINVPSHLENKMETSMRTRHVLKLLVLKREEKSMEMLIEISNYSALEMLSISLNIWRTSPFCSNSNTEWKDSQLGTAISRLQNLSQLCIMCPEYHPEKSIESYLYIARQFVSTNRKLRYIKLGRHAWRIWRRENSTPIMEGLEKMEIRGVELFTI